MKLYSLRRVSDGKFFVGTNGRGDWNMNSTPCFWKTPDSIWVNLKRVCSDYSPWKDHWGWDQKGWANFDAKKMAGWEVIVTTVHVLKQKRYTAKEFVDVAKLREMDVRVKKYPLAA